MFKKFNNRLNTCEEPDRRGKPVLKERYRFISLKRETSEPDHNKSVIVDLKK
jgi:hypothetical protein